MVFQSGEAKLRRENKSRAFAGNGTSFHFASMDFNKLSRDDQSQSATTMLTSAATINLTEGLEDHVRLLLRKATTGIDDGVLEHNFILSNLLWFGSVDPTTAEHLTNGGEFNCIADNI